VRARAGELLADLVRHTDAAFLLVSFSDEGFLSLEDMHDILGREGNVEVVEIPYAAFRGSRNLRSRSPRVTERLFLVER
jgi:adenine-specific DNA-methyltransferase